MKLSSRERFLAAMYRSPVDRAPSAHVAALTTIELQEQTGCKMPDVHHDADALVTLCGANHDVLGFDAVCFNINYFGEPAALGVEMNWGTASTYPNYVTHPWQTHEDAVIPDDLLSCPPISIYLEAVRLARRRYPHVGVIAKVMGPLSMVQVMHGVDQTMMDMIERPALIAHYLAVACEILARCAHAELEAGADAVSLGEGGAGGNMLSPRLHRRFLAPVHAGLLRDIAGPTVLHICGDILPRLDAIVDSRPTCFNFDWEIEPVTMVRAAQGRVSLMGNLSTTDLLLGSEEEIAAQVIANLDAGVEIIAPGCATSPECPNASFLAMHEAIARWTSSRT